MSVSMLSALPEALALSSSTSSSSTSQFGSSSSSDQWHASSDSQTDYSRPPTPKLHKELSHGSTTSYGYISQGDNGKTPARASFFDVEMEDSITPRPEQHWRLESLQDSISDDLGYESERELEVKITMLGKKTRRAKRLTTRKKGILGDSAAVMNSGFMNDHNKASAGSNNLEDERYLSFDPPPKPRLMPQPLNDFDLSPVFDLPPLLLPVPSLNASISLQPSVIKSRTQIHPNPITPELSRDMITIEDALSTLLGCRDYTKFNRSRPKSGSVCILGMPTPPDSSEGEDTYTDEMFSMAMAKLDLSGRSVGVELGSQPESIRALNDQGLILGEEVASRSTQSRLDELQWGSFMDLS